MSKTESPTIEQKELFTDFNNGVISFWEALEKFSSSKDARIKELEEQVKFWQNAEDKRDSEVKELEASEKSWKDKAEFHFSESTIASNKIKELEARLETAD